jgi:diguanylate cyclase (GGDEF)-like protein
VVRHPQSGTPRVLLIDDNRAIHEDFRKVLSPDTQSAAEYSFLAAEAILLGETPGCPQRPTFDIDSAYQGREGVETAQKAVAAGRPYCMAFVDMRMPPGWDGLETIEQLWKVDPHIQVVICSAHSDYDWFEVVGRLGHSDQLLVLRKPFEPIEAVQCATALVSKWQNEHAMRGQVESLEQAVTVRTQGLEAANQELRHLATHDALTGLPNRVLLDDRLAQAVAHADRYGESFALMMCDLDRFKLINDSMGHGAGDQLLQEVARRLTSVVRNIDTVARIGGDEFVIVLSPPASKSDAEEAARRALESMQPPVEIGGIGIHASPSIGIAYYPADAPNIQSLIARADAAMYAAKQVGHHKVQCYAPGMIAATQDKVRLESDLHSALELQQFELHFQPKIDIRTGAVNSAEALVRWRHPERGLILPGDFIPLAEECGLIGRIGDWVVREACRQGRAWQDDGLPPLRLAVNLSASQFRARYLVEMIRSALADANFEPRSLEVEITESVVMNDPEESIRTLERLSEMGVLISVDDFGTGYSSMSYLRRLPIDKLKIDRTFISEITARADDASIVHAIVSLAHSLHLKVIAEGVETTEQLEFLESIGCDQYQGYHFSRPLPPRDFEALMRRIQAERAAFTEADALHTHSKLAAYKHKSNR